METIRRALVVPVRTVSESNVRTHWSKRHARVRDQRKVTDALLRTTFGLCQQAPVCVRLVRIAPRELDDDNLRGALKAVRDSVAAWVGLDDRYLRFDYAQERSTKVRTYAVRIELEHLVQQGRAVAR